MSSVISQAKKFYVKSIAFFATFLFVLSALVALIKLEFGREFLGGCVAAFLPFCLSVYWVFFRQQAHNTTSVSVFYWAEILKWVTTILLILLMFQFVSNHLAFFAGYFTALIGNTVLPFLMKRSSKPTN